MQAAGAQSRRSMPPMNTQQTGSLPNVETVFLKRNSAYSKTVKGPCMCLSLKK